MKNRYEQLKSLISEHDYKYHVLDQPTISDYEYDQLFKELLDFESKHPHLISKDSPSQRVGGTTLENFVKVQHRTPMISLSNTYSPEELMEFDERTRKFLKTEELISQISYFVEPKYDGLAIELIYENGIFVKGITRGDGITGEDVTQNLKTIKSIPLALKTKNPPELLEVRGEILIYKKNFLEMNQQQDELGLPTFANPRNAASGTIRQLDPKITASRPLRFIAHGIGTQIGFEWTEHSEIVHSFRNWGLPTSSPELFKICKNMDEVVNFYQMVLGKRHDLPYEIDGIVLKINSRSLQDDLGMVARNPRWATAAKYPPERAETVIENIFIQVGRTGVLTPVAQMKPVKVGGVTITHATLHNVEEIQRKDIRIGDHVWVQRAGDVIPEVVEVILSKRKASSEEFKMPTTCPTCDSPVEKVEEEVAYRCTNIFCPSIIKESIKHFAGRKAMNIEKVGDKLINELVDTNLVRCFSDLYKLTKEDILSLERKGEKSAQNILTSIKKSKTTEFSKFIFALGIRFVGEQTAKNLANHFRSLEKFLTTTEEELLQLEDVGPKVAHSIFKAVHNSAFKKELSNLIKAGVTFDSTERKLDSDKLSGKTFLITGTLPVKRDDAISLIEKNGGKILSSVSSKLNYLIVGDDPGSKLEKAKGLGVDILDWHEFNKNFFHDN